MTGTERKRRWRLRNPIERRESERARSRRRSREYGGSYWAYEHGMNPFKRDGGRSMSRIRQKCLRSVATLGRLDAEIAVLQGML